MLKRLLLLKSVVTSQLAMIDKQDLYLSPDEWKMIEWTVQVLKPLKIISETLCGSKYPTMSIVYPSIRNLLDFALLEQKCPSPHPAIADLKSRIRMKLEHDFRDSTNEEEMSLCTLIDPRFKYLVITNTNQKEVMKSFKDQAIALRDDTETEVSFKPDVPVSGAKKRVRDDSSDGEDISQAPATKKRVKDAVRNSKQSNGEPNKETSIWSEMFGPSCGKVLQMKVKKRDMLQIEIDNYMDEEILSENECPLLWWKQHESKYPTLSLLAKKYLGTPASSVPCERIFSQAGQVITSKRNLLSVQHAAMYIFMKAYYNLGD